MKGLLYLTIFILFISSVTYASALTDNRSLITKDDITYLGSFTFPATEGLNNPLYRSWGAITTRYVNGQLHFLISGPSQKVSGWTQWPMLTEWIYPGQSITNPPTATLVQTWNDIWDGKNHGCADIAGRDDHVTNTDGDPNLFGLYLEPNTNNLWWGYSTPYEGFSHNPSIGVSVINDNGTAHCYGPWRTTIHSGYANGFILPIPPSFQQYTGGRDYVIGNPPHSASGSAAYGGDLQAFALPPINTPKDIINSDHTTISTLPLLWYPISHPQPRAVNFKMTNWLCASQTAPPGCTWWYDSSQGGVMSDPMPYFGGDSPGSAFLLDWIDATAWVDIPGGKYGIVQFGQLVDTIPNHTYPGGDTLAHNWYGPDTDAFGQFAPCSQSVGPGAGSIVSTVWITDPNDLISVAQGSADPWTPLPKETFQLNTIPGASSLNVGTCLYRWGGAVFDPVTSNIFITEKDSDSKAYTLWPTVLVFHVGSGPVITPTPTPVTEDRITITADNAYDLYFNGALLGSGGNWQASQTYPITAVNGKNVVAVKGVDYSPPAAVLAEINASGQRIGTSTSWKYSTSPANGWEQPNFDDSSWPQALDNGAYGTGPWSSTSIPGVPADTPAHWIWGPYAQTPVYFRFSFNTSSPDPISGLIIRGHITKSGGACAGCTISITIQDTNAAATTAGDGTFTLVFSNSFFTGSYTADITITDGATVKNFKKRISIS